MVEVLISVALLSMFSVAGLVAVASGAASSADNRARIAANGLAQRELSLVGEQIIGSPLGAAELLAQGSGGKVINPNRSPELQGSHVDPDYPFALDGEEYRVERTAEPHFVGAGSPCVKPDAETDRYGTMVRVAVSWKSAGPGARPHEVAKYFAPAAESGPGLEAGTALLVVTVTGPPDSAGSVYRKGVPVEVTGPGIPPQTQNTDAKGCTVFVVKPEPSGSDYTVKLGGSGTGKYVTPAGKEITVESVSGVIAGQTQMVKIENYAIAASLEITISNWNKDMKVIFVERTDPPSDAEILVPLNGKSTVKVNNLYPGNYKIYGEFGHITGALQVSGVGLPGGPDAVTLELK
jgi:hypothetical protein